MQLNGETLVLSEDLNDDGRFWVLSRHLPAGEHILTFEVLSLAERSLLLLIVKLIAMRVITEISFLQRYFLIFIHLIRLDALSPR